MACILVLALFMLNKKRLLYAIEILYVLEILYHALILHTISLDMEFRAAFRLIFGAVITFGGTALARYWINRRSAQRTWYESIFTGLRRWKNRTQSFCQMYLMSSARPSTW